MLLNLMLKATGCENELYLTDNLYTECAYYPEAGRLIVINNSGQEQKTAVKTKDGLINAVLQPYGQQEFVVK